MPQQAAYATENNFTKGLITESTGLNFPENAATDTSNCEYTLIGEVLPRLGINTEVNGVTQSVSILNQAISEYSWNNPGGDGNSKLLVKQIGRTLYFYNIATSTTAAPLSTQILAGTVSVSGNVVVGQTFDATSECQYADGNGYLFVYHKSCEPFYITYNAGFQTFTSNKITVQIRDFTGVVDNLPVSTRPLTLSTDHQYNLQNQGWTSGNAWLASISGGSITNGTNVYTVPAGMSGVSNGQLVSITFVGTLGGTGGSAAGTVTGYSGTSLTVNIFSLTPGAASGVNITIVPFGTGYLSTWNSAEGNYPSNADVWWYFKDSTGAFNPATTAGNVTLSTGNAPQGHYILNAFVQDRTSASGLSVTQVSTTTRPTTGAWFQGRVWYTGVSAFQAAAGDANFYTWTENIYFSQIVSGISDFGLCYQTNDPTSETLFDLLPTDGGVITIVGSGTIHKLWPIQNGMLVFANNGVWFITGSRGIGFDANDYTITKISSVRTISSKSFVDVMGMPFFWNEEGIYEVTVGQNGGQLTVEPITVGTILTYYNAIPLSSKKYARAAYDPIDYRIQWVFKSTPETSIIDRYHYDTILNYNTYNKAFFPYSVVSDGSHYINGIVYVSYPYISTQTPVPGFKYPSSDGVNNSFAEEYDGSYQDWGSAPYESYFVTGYKIRGQGIKKFNTPYVMIFSKGPGYNAYNIQGIWDYAINSNSGKWSTLQFVENFNENFGISFRRHKIRGRGMTLQFKVTSVPGQPFDIIGWSVLDNVNTSV